jgi:hypothetical protein
MGNQSKIANLDDCGKNAPFGEAIMEYPGPQAADNRNDRSLNREFLMLLGTRTQEARLLRTLPRSLALQLTALRTSQQERLADIPFLLFSFRERDDIYWDRLLAANGGADLFADARNVDDAQMRLIAAGLGFVWQLARQNPYAARLVCGASLHWCEQLAEKTLLEIVNVAASGADVLLLRTVGNAPLWHKLLKSGCSSEREVRHATHMSAMHCLLTAAHRGDAPRAAIAARRGLSPSLRVADKMDR